MLQQMFLRLHDRSCQIRKVHQGFDVERRETSQRQSYQNTRPEHPQIRGKPGVRAITLPKLQLAAHVAATESVCDLLEAHLRLPNGTLRLELMVETAQSILDRNGICLLQSFMDAAQGRCGSVHFAVYDYTASYGITAAWQAMGHPACLAPGRAASPKGGSDSIF